MKFARSDLQVRRLKSRDLKCRSHSDGYPRTADTLTSSPRHQIVSKPCNGLAYIKWCMLAAVPPADVVERTKLYMFDDAGLLTHHPGVALALKGGGAKVVQLQDNSLRTVPQGYNDYLSSPQKSQLES